MLSTTLYHGTSIERYEKIKTEGLKPSKDVNEMSALTRAWGFEHHAIHQTFMTPEMHLAEFWSAVAHGMESPGVVLEIALDYLDEKKIHSNEFMKHPDGEVAYDDTIPPENIKVKATIYPIINSWTMKPAKKMPTIKPFHMRILLNTP